MSDVDRHHLREDLSNGILDYQITNYGGQVLSPTESACKDLVADSWLFGFPGTIYSQRQIQDVCPSLAPKVSLDYLSRQPSNASPFFGRVPVACQMVATGREVEIGVPLQVPPQSLFQFTYVSQTG